MIREKCAVRLTPEERDRLEHMVWAGKSSARVATRARILLKPWQKQQWCIPKVSAEFVPAIKGMLDLHAEPHDPQGPTVCFDETSTQLLSETGAPLPAKPGRPRREDYEYQRARARNLFLTCEPRRGWRHVAITRQRTVQDFAHQMRWLVEEAYPDVPVIRLVLDNLSTHRMASLYETFPASEARRIAKRLELHHTPKHVSWLNMAEIEFSALARACLPGATEMRTAWKEPSAPACRSGTRQELPLTGGSLPKTPDANSIAFIPANPDTVQY